MATIDDTLTDDATGPGVDASAATEEETRPAAATTSSEDTALGVELAPTRVAGAVS